MFKGVTIGVVGLALLLQAECFAQENASSLTTAFKLLRQKISGSVSGTLVQSKQLVGRVNIDPVGDRYKIVFIGADKVEFDIGKDEVTVFQELDDGKKKQLSPSSTIKSAVETLSKALLFTSDANLSDETNRLFKGSWRFSEKGSLVSMAFRESYFSPKAELYHLHSDEFSVEHAELVQIDVDLNSAGRFSLLLD